MKSIKVLSKKNSLSGEPVTLTEYAFSDKELLQLLNKKMQLGFSSFKIKVECEDKEKRKNCDFTNNLKQLIGIYGLNRAMQVIDTMIKEHGIETIEELNDSILDDLYYAIDML